MAQDFNHIVNKEEAIAAIEDSCLTHIKWLDYYARGGPIDNEVAGGPEHHRQCIDKYLAVIEYIKSLGENNV